MKIINELPIIALAGLIGSVLMYLITIEELEPKGYGGFDNPYYWFFVIMSGIMFCISLLTLIIIINFKLKECEQNK